MNWYEANGFEKIQYNEDDPSTWHVLDEEADEND